MIALKLFLFTHTDNIYIVVIFDIHKFAKLGFLPKQFSKPER
jgi:hypothetical protein